jgi:hypothetical protein
MTTTKNKMDLYDKLREEIKTISADLLNCLFTLDTKIFHESKTLHSDYIKKLGQAEFKSFVLQNDILRTKKKIEVVTEIIKLGKYTDHEFIEKVVDLDFKETIERMQEQSNLIKLALKPSPSLNCTSKELIMIDKTYKSLLRNLYPDFVKEFTPKINNQLKEAIKAYVDYDLASLEKLEKEIEKVEILEAEVFEEEAKIARCTELLKVKSSFETKLHSAQKQLSEINKSFPFNVRNMLLNKDELKQKQLELDNQIAYYTKYFTKYKEEYQELLKEATKMNEKINNLKNAGKDSSSKSVNN